MPDKKPSKIDFRQYQTPELVRSVTDLIDVRGIYLRSAFKVLVTTVIVTLLILFAFWSRVEGIWWIPVLMAAVFAGTWLGGLYAIIQVVNQSFGNMTRIVDQLLELTKRIASDMRGISSGEIEKPTPAQLVKGAYTHVVLPVVETAISEQLGFLGGPVLFVYRMTLGQLVRLTIKMVPADVLTQAADGVSAEEAATETLTAMQKVADNEDRIVASLTVVQNKLRTIGGGLRILVMLPCFLSLAIMVVLIASGFSVVWVLLG